MPATHLVAGKERNLIVEVSEEQKNLISSYIEINDDQLIIGRRFDVTISIRRFGDSDRLDADKIEITTTL